MTDIIHKHNKTSFEIIQNYAGFTHIIEGCFIHDPGEQTCFRFIIKNENRNRRLIKMLGEEGHGIIKLKSLKELIAIITTLQIAKSTWEKIENDRKW